MMVNSKTARSIFLSIAFVVGLLSANDLVVSQQVGSRQSKLTTVTTIQEFEGSIVAGERIAVRNRTLLDLAVIWLVDEGTIVEEGDMLVQLDQSLLQDSVSQAKVELSSSKANLLKAESELERAKVFLDSYQQELKAKIALLKSEEEMMFSEHGEIAVRRTELESTIDVERERIKLIQVQLRRLKDAKEENEVQLLELDFQLTESKNKVRVAKVELMHLNEVLFEQKREQFAIQKALAESAAIRKLADAESMIAEAKVEVAAQATEVQLAEAKLERLIHDSQQCSIAAPQSGVVHYSHGDGAVIEEGEIIRPGQDILYLPDLDSLRVECEVPEAMIRQVKKGQGVTIAVDGDDFAGEVFSISNWPSSPRWAREGIATYKVTIRVADTKQLKIGQNARVKMKLE